VYDLGDAPAAPSRPSSNCFRARALERRVEGDCTVRYTVSAAGRVESPEVVGECHPLFVVPSLTAARRFRYQPRIVDGRAVAVQGVTNTFHYRVQEQARE
jgi:TonB family protein